MKNKKKTAEDHTIKKMQTDMGSDQTNPTFFVVSSEGIPEDLKVPKAHRMDHFSFMLLTKGEMVMRVNLIEYQLSANSILIIPPLTVHEFLYHSKNAAMIGIVFDVDFFGNAGLPKKQVDNFHFLASQDQPHILLSQEEADILYAEMLILKKRNINFNQHPFGQELLYFSFNIYMLELGGIFMKHRPKETLKHTRKEDLLMSFIKLLTNHFKEERSVQFYADALFISSKHLTRTIKELTTRTCSEFIDQMVITEAKVLLNDPKLSIGNVSDILHFSDQFFFSKFFKNLTGISPSEYKASI